MAAATRLAMTHLAEKVGDKPVHIAGYSTGAPLALDLTLNSFDEGELRTPDSLILISPAIGISAVAMLARPAAAIGRIPGFSQLGWSEITPEFDPYKYNSFTTNAGSQVRQLTESVASRIAKNSATQNRMPPIL
jgi:alpha-beta hydrolase superfamily lysophospholipase